MIKIRLFVLFTLFIYFISNAQVSSGGKMTIKLELQNPSSEINNGIAKVSVQGGKLLMNINGVM